MAWISIHDKIDGPKLRDLRSKLGCTKGEAMGILQSLWMWGQNNANKDGLILNADEYDIALVLASVIENGRVRKVEAEFIADELVGRGLCDKMNRYLAVSLVREAIDMFRPDADRVVQALIETRWIDRLEDGLYLHDWSEWQKEWYKYKDRLEKDAERKRKANEIAVKSEGNSTEIPQDNQNDGNVTLGEGQKPKRQRKDYSEEFKKFWEAYPTRRNAAKAEAYECFMARVANGIPEETLIEAAGNYARECRKQRIDEKYILQAKTFLGPHMRFADFLPDKKSEEPASETGNPFDKYLEE